MVGIKETVAGLFSGSIGCLWMIAGPVTYILNVVDTWSGRNPVWMKLLINLTLDAFLAAIWPITWILWGIYELMGKHTPLDLLFG
jgi:hypothetical protein